MNSTAALMGASAPQALQTIRHWLGARANLMNTMRKTFRSPFGALSAQATCQSRLPSIVRFAIYISIQVIFKGTETNGLVHWSVTTCVRGAGNRLGNIIRSWSATCSITHYMQDASTIAILGKSLPHFYLVLSIRLALKPSYYSSSVPAMH